MTSPWTGRENSASGQTYEFRVWAALTEQSRGSLHVFLPTADRGVDGMVHRLADGAYVLLQAKDRSRLVDGEVHIVVWAHSLAHDDVVIVGGQLVDGGMGPTTLVVPVPDFKRLATLSSNDGEPIYSMYFGMRPRSDSRWLPWLVPTERMAERLGVSVEGVLEEAPAEPRPEWRSDLGSLGESEVVRRLTEDFDLNLFRPYPDFETVELAVLHLVSRRVVGLQIKTVDITAARLHANVNVHAASFRPWPSTYFVVLGWRRDESRFHEEFLLIPSMELSDFARDDGRGHLSFQFHADSIAQDRLHKYRHGLDELRTLVSNLV
ncbi:MAG TPA: hypothetical protein VFH00_05960 [Candidatus Nitrosotalea sp.]|nr:hypothetical protein [Candidatus Nitrosotalea sp.]